MVANDLSEIDLRDSEEQVTIQRPTAWSTPQINQQTAASPTAISGAAESATATQEPADLGGLVAVQSPMVGTFYAAASPDADALVKVGSAVAEGDVVCLIEAMKIFNEIKAETAGTIQKILVANGDAVEFGPGPLPRQARLTEARARSDRVFSRILIANRGEIALRIIRAARELGVETVCVYSEADRDGPWLEQADQTVCIGPGPAAESYLRIDRIIAAAETTNTDAIHPGYGFLAENAHFAEICNECHIAFIGPSPEAMGLLGDKVSCRAMAKKAGTPIFPGSPGEIEEEDKAVSVAEKIGYPVIVKASAGGGGRGMRIARDEQELRAALVSARQEAEAAFGNGAVYVEKFLERARHVEVQCLGDQHGNAIHLYSRDCTSQRRHQKLIEEGPAPGDFRVTT